jgi:hypothetical protein
VRPQKTMEKANRALLKFSNLLSSSPNEPLNKSMF